MQYGKLAGLLAAVGVAVGGGWWLSTKQLDEAAAGGAQATQVRQETVRKAAADTSGAKDEKVAVAGGRMAGSGKTAVRPVVGMQESEGLAGAKMADGKRQHEGGKLAVAASSSREMMARPVSSRARAQPGSVEVMLQAMGDVMATMGGTVARVADTFIVVLSGELEQTRKLAAGEGGNELADVVRQMEAREELQRPGLKGPIRRFMDKYCILGYLTGKGTCDR